MESITSPEESLFIFLIIWVDGVKKIKFRVLCVFQINIELSVTVKEIVENNLPTPNLLNNNATLNASWMTRMKDVIIFTRRMYLIHFV